MKYFRFVATLDSRTSEKCRDHDGKICSIDDADIGENDPPRHPRCRSIIVGRLVGVELKGKTRLAKAQDGKYIHVSSDMTYKEWYNTYVKNTETDVLAGLKTANGITIT